MSPERERGDAWSKSIASRCDGVGRTCSAEAAVDRLKPSGNRACSGAADCRCGGMHRRETATEIAPAIIKANRQNDLRAPNGDDGQRKTIARRRLRVRPVGNFAGRTSTSVRSSPRLAMQRYHDRHFHRNPLRVAGWPLMPKLHARRGERPLLSVSRPPGYPRLGAGR